MRKHPLLCLLAIGLLTALLPGGLTPAAIHAQDGATLRLGMQPLPGTTAQIAVPVPMTLAPDAADARDLVENLVVGLFRYDAAAGEAVPLLAREWSVGADGLTWTFSLRDDMPWVSHDANTGAIKTLRPVSAQDFVTALRMACDPRQPSPDGNAIFAIRGCYTAAQADPLLVTDDRVADWVGAEAPDDATLILHAAYPLAYLPSLLTLPEFRPVPREFVGFTPAWPALAANGPFVLTAHTPDEALVLERNPFWPEAVAGDITRVEISLLPDAPALANAFTSGAIDFARLGAAGGLDLSGLPADSVQTWPGRATIVLGYGTEHAFVSEARVRQALAWAVDRDALAALGLVPADTFTPPQAIAGPEATVGVGNAPDAARAALADAGYANCGGVPDVLDLAAPPDLVPLAEALVGQWTAALNCSPELFRIVPTDAGTVLAAARGLIDAENDVRPALWLVAWTPDAPDANNGAADAFDCRYGYFYSGLPCGPTDALAAWAGTYSGDDRATVYASLEARLFGPAGSYPVAPLGVQAQAVAVRPGLMANPVGAAWWGEGNFEW